MNIGEYAIRKKTITLVLTVVTAVGGLLAFDKLGRLEDPEFTIKQALITTSYPGAAPEDVEKEVTNEIEMAVQRLGQLKRIKDSLSMRGKSIVEVEIKDKYDKQGLPQVWDELRRKVGEVRLPPGCGVPVVNDDFGDVYGAYVAIRGDGYSYRELKDFANLLRRELLLVQDVKRIVFWGGQPESIYIEIKRDKMAQLGITQEQIFDLLKARNLAADGGKVEVGTEYITVSPTGMFASEEEFRRLLISEPGASQLIYLGDVAEVRRGYVDPPQQLLRSSKKVVFHNGRQLYDEEVDNLDPEVLSGPDVDIRTVIGQPAIGLAISTVMGGNVVTMGEALNKRFQELQPRAPIGMDIDIIAMQSTAVTKSINSFMMNLIEAIIIVIIVLLIFMGLRSGLLIGFILFLTIAATFIVMLTQGVLLERISLGALIIALGMLVDNAIVVTEGMKIKIEGGQDKIEAAKDVVSQNQWPLLGATLVAIIAFGAIGLSQDKTGEYCRSLFTVLWISLALSWLTAVTVTPLLCVMLFKPLPKKEGEEEKDPYAGGVFRGYRWLLETCIRFRPLTIALVIALFAGAIWGFGRLKDAFFPDSTRPQIMVDVWLPEGTHIRDTEASIAPLEEFIMGRPNTLRVASHVGAGGARFMLVYTGEKENTAYAQLLVTVQDPNGVEADREAIQQWMDKNLSDAVTFTKPFKLGPGEGGNMQARFSGPDPDVLRELAAAGIYLIDKDGASQGTRHNWRERVKVIEPTMAQAQAQRNGITRQDIARRIQDSFEGQRVGVFREGTRDTEDRIIPIISRSPAEEREDVESIYDLQIFSPAANTMIPMRQVITGFETGYEDAIIHRRDRKRTITIHFDQKEGESSTVLNRMLPLFAEIIPAWEKSGRIPAGRYELDWGGEYEDGNESKAALASSIPMFLVMMVLIVIMLFNNLRQPLIIWLTVPLALIGVSAGLLTFDQPFNFMAILGTLSLVGMLIKNAIVLMDQINLNRADGIEPYEAVISAGVSRMRPVVMAAATTVLGMIPLLTDAFFVAMAIAVMFGLTFATLLTLIIVPTLYTVFYGLKRPA